ncbi:MAG TPA: hypothetical protein VK469_14930 [Candidatus Kapabacteria bacterium]|nr:hypothetical protein [Candidatus Kapabacteria bacterium]
MSRAICLKCIQCRCNLSGENNSKVFFCHTCALAFNVDTALGKLLPYPLLYIKPRGTAETGQVYFPFWQFESRYTLDGSVPVDSSFSRTFYIPAFFIKNINYFGDIGYFYMKHKVILEPGPRNRIEVFAADRDIRHAARYPQIYLAKENYPTLRDMKKGFPEVQVKHLKAGVILVPFYKTEHSYVDSILSWKYPSGALI